jgi:hypothetical protein
MNLRKKVKINKIKLDFHVFISYIKERTKILTKGGNYVC